MYTTRIYNIETGGDRDAHHAGRTPRFVRAAALPEGGREQPGGGFALGHFPHAVSIGSWCPGGMSGWMGVGNANHTFMTKRHYAIIYLPYKQNSMYICTRVVNNILQ